MGVKTEKIDGKLILNEYESSNILSSVYNTDNKELKVSFKGGRTYIYDEVPHKIFTKLRMSDSQGKFFNQNISRNYKYKEVK